LLLHRVPLPVRIQYLVPGSVWCRGNSVGSGSDSADNGIITCLWDFQSARDFPWVRLPPHTFPYFPMFILGWCSALKCGLQAAQYTLGWVLCTSLGIWPQSACVREKGGRLCCWWSLCSSHRKWPSVIGNTKCEAPKCVPGLPQQSTQAWVFDEGDIKLWNWSSQFWELIPLCAWN